MRFSGRSSTRRMFTFSDAPSSFSITWVGSCEDTKTASRARDARGVSTLVGLRWGCQFATRREMRWVKHAAIARDPRAGKCHREESDTNRGASVPKVDGVGDRKWCERRIVHEYADRIRPTSPE